MKDKLLVCSLYSGYRLIFNMVQYPSTSMTSAIIIVVHLLTLATLIRWVTVIDSSLTWYSIHLHLWQVQLLFIY